MSRKVGIVALVGLSGCGGAGHPTGPLTVTRAVVPLGSTPIVVADYAARAARRVDFPVLVPERFPALGSSRVVYWP